MTTYKSFSDESLARKRTWVSNRNNKIIIDQLFQSGAFNEDRGTLQEKIESECKIGDPNTGEKSFECYIPHIQNRQKVVSTTNSYAKNSTASAIKQFLESTPPSLRDEIQRLNRANNAKGKNRQDPIQMINRFVDLRNPDYKSALTASIEAGDFGQYSSIEQKLQEVHEQLNKKSGIMNSSYQIWSGLNAACNLEKSYRSGCGDEHLEKYASFDGIDFIPFRPQMTDDSSEGLTGKEVEDLQSPNKSPPLLEEQEMASDFCEYTIPRYEEFKKKAKSGKYLPTEYAAAKKDIVQCLNYCLNHPELKKQYPKYCDAANEGYKANKYAIIQDVIKDKGSKWNAENLSWVCQEGWNAPYINKHGVATSRNMSKSLACKKIKQGGLQVFEADLLPVLGTAAYEMSYQNYDAYSDIHKDLHAHMPGQSGYMFYPYILRKVALSRAIQAQCELTGIDPKIPKNCKQHHGEMSKKGICNKSREKSKVSPQDMQKDAKQMTGLFEERRKINDQISSAAFDGIKGILTKASGFGFLYECSKGNCTPKPEYDKVMEYFSLQEKLKVIEAQLLTLGAKNPLLIQDFSAAEGGAFFEEDLDKKEILKTALNNPNKSIKIAREKSAQNMKGTLSSICDMNTAQLIRRTELTGQTLELFPQFEVAHLCYDLMFDSEDLKEIGTSLQPGLALLCLPLAFGGPPGIYASAACGAAYLGYSGAVYSTKSSELEIYNRCIQTGISPKICSDKPPQEIIDEYNVAKWDFYLSAGGTVVEGIAVGVHGTRGLTQMYKAMKAEGSKEALEIIAEIDNLKHLHPDLAKKEAKAILKKIRGKPFYNKLPIDSAQTELAERSARYINPNPKKYSSTPQELIEHHLDVHKGVDPEIQEILTVSDRSNPVMIDSIQYHDRDAWRAHQQWSSYTPNVDKTNTIIQDSNFHKLNDLYRNVKNQKFDLDKLSSNPDLIKKVFSPPPGGFTDEALAQLQKQIKFFQKEGYELVIDTTCNTYGAGGYHLGGNAKVIAMPEPPYDYLTWLHELQHLTLHKYMPESKFLKLRQMSKQIESADPENATYINDVVEGVLGSLKGDYYNERDIERLRQALKPENPIPYVGLHELLSTGKEIDAFFGLKKTTDKVSFKKYWKNRGWVSRKNNYVTNHSYKNLIRKKNPTAAEKKLIEHINSRLGGNWTSDPEFIRNLQANPVSAQVVKNQLIKLKEALTAGPTGKAAAPALSGGLLAGIALESGILEDFSIVEKGDKSILVSNNGEVAVAISNGGKAVTITDRQGKVEQLY